MSLLIAALVAASIADRQKIDMPLCGVCDDDRRKVRLLRWGLAAGAVLLMMGGAINGWLGALGALLAVVWVFSLTTVVEPLYTVGGFVIDEHYVQLNNVHPAFAAAMRPNPAWAYGPAVPQHQAQWQPAQQQPQWQQPQPQPSDWTTGAQRGYYG